MTDTKVPSTPDATGANLAHPRGLGRKLFWVSLIVLILLVAWRPLKALHRPFCPPRHWGMAPASVLELDEQMDQAADWFLVRLKATGEQRARILEIRNDLMPDLYAFQHEHDALHAQLNLALDAAPVNPQELERIRAASLNLADRASQRAVDSFVQVLGVLTAEQRAELLELWRHSR